MSDFQLYSRLYSHIHEYQKLIYDIYSKHAIAYLTTYYNIDSTATVWENVKIFGGAYERIGDLSGLKWNKYLLLPIYFPEEIPTIFDADERGYFKLNETHIVIPSSYGITPYPGDIIKLEQGYLRPTNDTYPIFMVMGVEKSANADRTFWKLRIETRADSTESLNPQINKVYTFFDYTKEIYTLNQSIFLTRMMTKMESLKNRLDNFYDNNSGIYLI